MLEIINGFLLVYFVILCTISALVPTLVKPIVACFSKVSSEDRYAWAELIELREVQKGISIKDEFAAYSKLQRKINKLESQLKEKRSSRMGKNLAIIGSLNIILQVVIALVIVLSVIWFRREPIVALKGDLSPLSTILQYPSEKPNSISTHMWVLITNLSVRTLLKPILS